MPKYKFKYKDKNFVTLLPNGEAVSLNGEAVSSTSPGTKTQPPKTKETRGITDADLQKYAKDPTFKQIIERYFTVVDDKETSSKVKAPSTSSKKETKAEEADSKS
jgi:hypothetical protein